VKSDQNVVVHRDGTASVLIESLAEDAMPGHADAWAWFLGKSPEERATVIIRAYQDADAWE